MNDVKRRFKVSTRHSGLRRFVTVTVYDEIDDLRREADRYTVWTGTYREGQFQNALGVTQSFESFVIGEGDAPPRRGAAGVHIRLWRERLGTSVVTHEVCHAAAAIYGQDCLETRGPIHDNMEAEEVFSYLVGDLSARIVNRLYHYGYYEETA